MTNFDTKYNNGLVNYNYSRACKTWEFKFPVADKVNTVLAPAKGKVTAEKIASVIAGSLKRCKELDGLARAGISRLTL